MGILASVLINQVPRSFQKKNLFPGVAIPCVRTILQRFLGQQGANVFLHPGLLGKDGHGSVPSEAADVQPGSLSCRKHHHKDFVLRSKCSGKVYRNGLSLPPTRPVVAEP